MARTVASQIERHRSIARHCNGFREISCRGTFLLVLRNDTTPKSTHRRHNFETLVVANIFLPSYPEISPIILTRPWFINREQAFLSTFCNKAIGRKTDRSGTKELSWVLNECKSALPDGTRMMDSVLAVASVKRKCFHLVALPIWPPWWMSLRKFLECSREESNSRFERGFFV